MGRLEIQSGLLAPLVSTSSSPSLLLCNRPDAGWCPNVFDDSLFLLDDEMMHVSVVLRPGHTWGGLPMPASISFLALNALRFSQGEIWSYPTHHSVHTALCTWGRVALAQTWRASWVNKILGSVCVCFRLVLSPICGTFLGKSLIGSVLKFLHF